MKKLFSLIAVFSLIFSITGFCFAASPVIESQTVTTETLEDGTVVETIFTIYQNLARTEMKSADLTRNYTDDNGKKIASVTLYASFSYDGDDAWVLSSYSDVSEYNGWNYGNERITESGGTVKLTAKLTKSGQTSRNPSLSITCSANGRITKN